MDNRPSTPGGFLDHTAIALSGLCLAHCLLLPVTVALLPLLNRFDAGHFHAQMLFVVVPVSLLAFALGFRRHRHSVILAWGLVGMTTMIFAGTIGHANYGALADTGLTVIGSFVLATAHYFNNRLTRHAKSIALSAN
jgi:hypothetical protein